MTRPKTISDLLSVLTILLASALLVAGSVKDLRERIKLISDKELVIQEDNSKFIVRLPIISTK